MFKELLSMGLIVLGASPTVAQTTETASELPPTGLKFADPSQLRGIPLAELPYAGFELPMRVDLSEHMPRPGVQGKQNSCVAWVSAYAVKTYQEKLEQRYTLTRSGQMDMKKIFSPAFVYNQINQGRDGGATLIDALNLLSGRGALSWADMPYEIANFTRQPSSTQIKQARRYRIAYWRQVNISDQRELKAHLLAGYPIMIGALIDESLARLRPGTVWRHSAGKSLGGHAMVLVGYDEGRHAFKLMNSWGTDWADGGFAWIDYKQLAQVIREGYVSKDALNDRPPDLAMTDTDNDGTTLSGDAYSSGDERDENNLEGGHSGGVPETEQDDERKAEPGQPADAEDEESDDDFGDDEDDEADDEAGGEAEAGPDTDKPQPPASVTQPSLADLLRQMDRDQPSQESNQNRQREDRPPIYEQSEEQVFKPVQVLQQRIEGKWLILEGRARLLDDRSGREAQVLVRFFGDALASKNIKAADPAFALPDGAAVAISPAQAANRSLLSWKARIPLDQLPSDLNGLWLRPVLYLDRFGIDSGELIRLRPLRQ